MTTEHKAKRIVYEAFQDNHMFRDDVLDNEFVMITLEELIDKGYLKRIEE